MSRRRKSTAPPRCNHCGAQITFYRSVTGTLRPFDLRPVNGRTYTGPGAFPIFGGRAWHVADLIAELMSRTSQSSADAEDEAYDIDWYVVHACLSAHYGTD